MRAGGGGLLVQIDFDTSLKVKQLAKLRARAGIIWAMPKRKGVFFWDSLPYHSVDQAWVDKALVQDVAKLDEDSCHAVIVGKILYFLIKSKYVQAIPRKFI